MNKPIFTIKHLVLYGIFVSLCSSFVSAYLAHKRGSHVKHSEHSGKSLIKADEANERQ